MPIEIERRYICASCGLVYLYKRDASLFERLESLSLPGGWTLIKGELICHRHRIAIATREGDVETVIEPHNDSDFTGPFIEPTPESVLAEATLPQPIDADPRASRVEQLLQDNHRARCALSRAVAVMAQVQGCDIGSERRLALIAAMEQARQELNPTSRPREPVAPHQYQED